MKKKLPEQDEFYKRMAVQSKSLQVHFRVKPATAEMLSLLADWSGRDKSAVITALIHQAYADAQMDGHVLAFEE